MTDNGDVMWRGLAVALVAAVAMTRLRGTQSTGVATIVNSGSTNRAGFRIEVQRSGVAAWNATGGKLTAPEAQAKPIEQTLPTALVEQFYADLEAAKPLSSMPEVHCMKSASFGSSLTVALGEEQTPDLSCGDGGNAAMRNLIRDVDQIVALFRNSAAAEPGKLSCRC